MKAVRWVYRYGNLEAEVFDSLESAIRAAILDDGLDQDDLDFIECDGERITEDHPTYRAIKEEHDRADRHRGEAADPTTHLMKVRHPDGEWVVVFGLTDPVPPTRGSAKIWGQFIDALGGSRVQITPISTQRTA